LGKIASPLSDALNEKKQNRIIFGLEFQLEAPELSNTLFVPFS
jgi:hypothetical protein